MAGINGISLPFLPAGGANELNRRSDPIGVPEARSEFGEIFQKELDKLKFSAHAQSRMISREISISESEMARLESAVNEVRGKGGENSLILLDDKAFIVSASNRTVITAVDPGSMESRVVTDIDSAVFA